MLTSYTRTVPDIRKVQPFFYWEFLLSCGVSAVEGYTPLLHFCI